MYSMTKPFASVAAMLLARETGRSCERPGVQDLPKLKNLR